MDGRSNHVGFAAIPAERGQITIEFALFLASAENGTGALVYSGAPITGGFSIAETPYSNPTVLLTPSFYLDKDKNGNLIGREDWSNYVKFKLTFYNPTKTKKFLFFDYNIDYTIWDAKAWNTSGTGLMISRLGHVWTRDPYGYGVLDPNIIDGTTTRIVCKYVTKDQIDMPYDDIPEPEVVLA